MKMKNSIKYEVRSTKFEIRIWALKSTLFSCFAGFLSDNKIV